VTSETEIQHPTGSNTVHGLINTSVRVRLSKTTSSTAQLAICHSGLMVNVLAFALRLADPSSNTLVSNFRQRFRSSYYFAAVQQQ